MNRFLATLACLVAVSAPAAAEEVKIGDTVLAHWAVGNAYFVGTVVEEQRAGFLVVFEDGDTAVVSKTKIRKNDIKAGSQVYARWNDGEYYRGKVAKIVGRALFIQYDDGDNGWVAWSCIAVR